jgi:hypothetical protein
MATLITTCVVKNLDSQSGDTDAEQYSSTIVIVFGFEEPLVWINLNVDFRRVEDAEAHFAAGTLRPTGRIDGLPYLQAHRRTG